MFDTGRIIVYDSSELTFILPKYYDHSKYSSFVRQLANYEFCKLPCKDKGVQIFVHEKTTEDVHSILKLKVCFIAIN